MDNQKYEYYQTFYDVIQFRKIVLLLKQKNIDFKIIDKSNQTNFRVPQSTYVEIELHINIKDFERTDKILAELK